VLVDPWTVQENERGDILWRYTVGQVDWLRRRNFLKDISED